MFFQGQLPVSECSLVLVEQWSEAVGRKIKSLYLSVNIINGALNGDTLQIELKYLEMLVFEDREKPEYLRKTSQSKDKNQQQTQPT